MDLETLRASRTLREIKTAAVVEQGRGGLATSGVAGRAALPGFATLPPDP